MKKVEDIKMKKITAPQQKTFVQNTTEKLDAEVNAWLLERAKAGKQMPMHGKSFCAPYTNENPDQCAVYYFAETVEVEDTNEKV